MRIVVNHLTRMDAPRICVAGIDPSTGRCVRPTTGRRHPLTRDLLTESGGPFTVGALIELGDVTPDPKRPEMEDHLFWPERARLVGRLSSNRYLELLHEHAVGGLHTIFGDDLVRHERNYAVDANRGAVSLGVLKVRRRPDLEVDRYNKLRLRLNDEKRPAFLSVTDLRFVEADHRTIKTEIVDDVRARMRRGVEVLLMLGLARAFKKPGDEGERHWLQVNGICMADRPLAGQP
ncbi:MAG TPA: hypothetical protein VES97_03595 [Solirubrobacteraceae bacterium]|nr:hypothetical protein [Solirubrobacteraceae bacterium]